MISLLAVSAAVLLTAAQCAPFEVSLNTADQYTLGKPVLCEVVLTNTLDKDLHLYTRNTPLGGLKSDIFSVSLNGKRIHYDGLVFKKAPVNKDSSRHVSVAGGESMSIEVDLSMAYAMSGPGAYSVQMTANVSYQDKAGNISTQHITSQLVAFDIIGNKNLPLLTLGEKVRLSQSNTNKHVMSPMGSALTPNFTGDGDSVEQKDALRSWNDAYTSVVASPESAKKEDQHFIKWFGAGDKDDGRVFTVEGAFEEIQLSMETRKYTLYFKGPECERDDFAYTSYGSSSIYLCMGYFRAQDTHGFNSKLGTFVHQLGIAAVDLVDYTHIGTPEECQNLAKDVPLRAIKSAYNYEYFVEDPDSTSD